ncbi:hypothetical protein [Algivirga pacifica]|uniref:Uncharacterized protein n=1 Tax=Algivirga pacifica TaxID=1162670 RepID=A0ABP9D858_9BACT
MTDTKKSNWAVLIPVLGTITVAILGGVFSFLGVMSQKKAEAQQKATEFKVKLVEKVIKENTREQSIQNLKFFIESGLIKDDEGKLWDLIAEKEEIPAYLTVPDFFEGFEILYPQAYTDVKVGTLEVEGRYKGLIEQKTYQLWLVATANGQQNYTADHPALISTSHKWKGNITIDTPGNYTVLAYLTTKTYADSLRYEVMNTNYISTFDSLWLVDFVTVKVKGNR